MPTGEDNLLALTQWVGAVGTLGQLYAKFPAGGLYGMFGLVTGRNKFAAWNINTRQWEFTDNTVDTFPDNFITTEPILGLPANTDISGITAVELLSLISKLRTRVSTISELVEDATWTVDEVLYIPYEVIITVDGDTKANNGTYCLALGKDYTAIEDWVKTSVAGSDTFTSDFTANPTFGKYTAGQTVPANGKTPSEVLLDAFCNYLSPAFTAFASSLASVVEVGETVSGNVNFTFGLSNAGNVLANTLSITDNTASQVLVSAQAVTSPIAVNIGIVKKTANGATNIWKASVVNSNNQTVYSGLTSVAWLNKVFHSAVDTVPATSADVRALTAVWRSQTTLSVNINKPTYVICVPAGMSVKSAITASFEDITSEFINSGTIAVMMPDGVTAVNYSIFKYQKPVALGATATIILQ